MGKKKETKKSNRPTGLTITRNGKNFTLTWKSSSTNEKQTTAHGYDNSQAVKHSVSESDTSWTLENMNTSLFYPDTNHKLKSVHIGVCRKAVTTETEKKITNYTTSDWATKAFELYDLSDKKAPRPVAIASKVDDLTAKYEFSINSKDDSHYWILGIETQTCWTKCENIQDPSSIKEFTGPVFVASKHHNQWHDFRRHSGSNFTVTNREWRDDQPAYPENFIDVGKNNAYYTRWYRYRTYGPAGVGKWYYVWFTFGTPYRPVLKDATIKKIEASQTYIIHAKWETPSNKYTRPADTADVQYYVGKPSTEVYHHIEEDELFTQYKALYKLLSIMRYEYYVVRNPSINNISKYYEYGLHDGQIGYFLTKDKTVNPSKTYYRRKEIKWVRARMEDLQNEIDKLYVLNDVRPEDPSWQDLVTDLPDTTGDDATTKQIDLTINEDDCAWIRVVSNHAGWKRYSVTKLLTPKDFSYSLAEPESLDVELGDNNNLAEISVTKRTQVEKASTVVVCKEKGEKSANPYIIGIIDYDDFMPATISYPSELINKVHFGAYSAIVKDREEHEHTKNGAYDYSTYQFEVPNNLQSGIQWKGGLVPEKPTITLIEYVDDSDGPSIHVKWEPPENVREVEISWSDKSHGWYSDNDPSSKVIKSINRNELYILSVEKGGTYYIRARSIRYDDDNPTYSGYTTVRSITLADTPETPVLYLSKDAVTVDGSFTASWTYYVDDNTMQRTATLVPADMKRDINGNVTDTVQSYGASIATVNGASQSITLSAAELMSKYKWTIGSTHYLSVMVTSTSGKNSAWSKPVSIAILDPLVCKITSSTLVYGGYTPTGKSGKIYSKEQVSDQPTETILEDSLSHTSIIYSSNADAINIGGSGIYSLKELPLTVDVSGAGDANHVAVSIIRATDYMLPRPNGKNAGGYEGDIVASLERIGDGSVTFTRDDLNQDRYFDDGAVYTLKAVITDDYGQTSDSNENSDDERLFIVEWTNQALDIPDENVSVVIDTTSYRVPVAKINVTSPLGIRSSDRFDLYRLSSDDPELIFKGAEFDTDYIDPYPTIGTKGGYRIVFMTANGDYITAENKISWVDVDVDFAERYGLENQVFFKTPNNVIDFNGITVNIPYNIDLSTSWKKEFKETKYLGGHVIGDWNEGVSRTGSISTQVQTDDADTISKLRQLAVYSGVCHVRTIDGSNYKADVQVSESHSYQSYVITQYSLNVTRIDSYTMDAMTKSDWETYYA